MNVLLEKGRYRARQSKAACDIKRAQALRLIAFGCDDRDALDDLCTHIVVENIADGTVLCCFRMLHLNGVDLHQSYCAQFYDLSALEAYKGAMLEMGRFCTHPDYSNDPDLLRIAWGAMTAFVDEHSVELLFGCSSFAGTEPADYAASFAFLKAHHIAPVVWRPKAKAEDIVRFERQSAGTGGLSKTDAMRNMPPLLRTYLMMGGWVSDHAVVDQKMNTLHVFTGVEIQAIPAARKRLLRAVVG